MVRLQCPDCGTTIDAEPGHEARCPSCGFSATVPPDVGGSGPGAAPAPYSARPFGAGPESGSYTAPAGPVPGSQGYGQGQAHGQQGYGQQGYGHPGQQPYPYQQQPTNGMCTAALVMGIVGFCLPVVTSILAIVFGIIGKNQAKERNEKGDGMAIAGIVLGSIQLALGALWFLSFPFFMGGFIEVAATWP